ncbi:hypothetical protein [Methylobacterium platani]|uniref:Uncharacterized protein n=1 Tax=Methylobacterium platani TaxID=427683 RepID=A0A179SJM3_9HYPH|nr:hypothetical protein [Methylobacterium platani]OAS27220.1 hypothetical protein A5481_01990 [Methylobacterium platani]
MVDQNDVAAAPAAAPSTTGGSAAPAGLSRPHSWLNPKLKTTTAAGLLCAACIGALAGGATVALMNAAQGGGAGIPQAEWARLSGRVETGATEATRLTTDLSLLRDRAAQAQEAADKGRVETGARLGQVSERLERLHRQEADLAGKVVAVADRLAAMAERQEHADREQAVRLAALTDKLEKRQAPVAAAPTVPVPVAAAPAAVASPVAPGPTAQRHVAAAEPALTGSLPDKPADKAKPATIETWILRDVYDGVAMIENRNRRLVEVGPGDTLPGAGRVEAIERRGRSWVVVTSKGLITPQAW